MAPGLFRGWRGEWRLRRGTTAFVTRISEEPDPDDVQWLASVATDGDPDRARWELRYARRALGLLAAERDALDDRTGSMVARALSEALLVDRNIAAGMVRVAERQFNERLGMYRRVLTSRDATEGTGARLGRALLQAAGAGARPDSEAIARGGALLARYLGGANEALRLSFGAPTLPEDQPPSIAVERTRR
ncbi:MAG TPA: hypothetical protein VLE53_09095 [Gemmatimonadaceae bacterium]|nr:hypothetical protein [Gemmatimonadaceae bacterium]